MIKVKIAYYPGCTLKTNAKIFEETAIPAFEQLGIEFVELKNWYCCGTVYSIALDNLMYRLASIRNLIRAQEQGFDQLTTLCSICYNTLKQANNMAKEDKESMDKVNAFMDEEPDYNGSVNIIHPLKLAKERLHEIKKLVKNPLGKKYAAYYGCLLLRPIDIAVDDYENPVIIEQLIETLGGEPIKFPLKNECCGSYNVTDDKNTVLERTYRIVTNARKNGAEGIVTSCPLCYYNLKDMQQDVKKKKSDFVEIPVYYFTELMLDAFGGKK